MRNLIPYLFLFLFLGILAGAITYLSRRFNWYFSIPNTRIMYFIFAALTLFMIAGIIVMSNTTSRFGSLVYMLAAVTMGVLLYSLLSVVGTDLVRLFTNFTPKTYGTIVLALTFSLSSIGMINAWSPRITEFSLGMEGLSKEVRIMQLSDIHLGHFRGKKFLQNIVDKSNRVHPDAVFITGDLFDGRINLNLETLAPLTQLQVPVFFIEGNHDRYTGVTTIKNYLRQLNVHVLENEIATWNDLQIIGLNHMRPDDLSYNMHAAGNSNTIKGTLERLAVRKDMPTVLLHHSPDGIQYAEKYGVDLYLAGHTHGGQLFPINYLARLLFAYNKGLHEYKGTRIFVSEGAGTFGPPMRLGTKSEMTLITLKPE